MKRMITILGISIGITAIGIITRTLPIISAIMMIILVIEYGTRAINYLKNLFNTKKYYNKLLAHIEYVKLLEHERHKAYFIYHGEELKEKIEMYDNTIKKYYELIDIYTKLIELNKKYLGKRKYGRVLEIAKEIRKPDRA